MNPKAVAFLHEDGGLDDLLRSTVIKRLGQIKNSFGFIRLHPADSHQSSRTVAGRLRFAAQQLAIYQAQVKAAQDAVREIAEAIGVNLDEQGEVTE